MNLSLVIFLDRIGILRRTLPRLLPYVDHVEWAIDTRAHREVAEFARSVGGNIVHHEWADCFSRPINAAIARCPDGWAFNLDSDEDIDHPELLRPLCEQGEKEGIDVFGLPRRHWWDLRRHEEKADWFPLHQWRLMRTTTRLQYRVHQCIRQPAVMRLVDSPCLDHFNIALRLPEDWAATNSFYARLLQLDATEGRDISAFG